MPVSPTPAGPWDRKVPETHGDPAKKLHLDEIYRSVPAMPPGTDRKAGTQKSRTARLTPLFTFERWPLRARMTRVMNSLKRPCAISYESKLAPSHLFKFADPPLGGVTAW